MTADTHSPLTAVALVCTLKRSPEPSSSELLAAQMLDNLEAHDVDGTMIRLVDRDIAFGVDLDMGGGDGWPAVRAQILAADIVIVVAPIWMGHASSITQQLIERLDAELSEKDDRNLPELHDRVAIVGVVGNEDGAHKVTADLYQALNDVGFTIPAQGGTYWNGEAMQTVDYRDLSSVPGEVADATNAAVANAVHLAAMLKQHPYPKR